MRRASCWRCPKTRQPCRRYARAGRDCAVEGAGNPADDGVRHRKKTSGVLCAGRAARYAWISLMKGCWPITPMCTVVQVSASGYFHRYTSMRGAKRSGCGRHSHDTLLVHVRAIHAQSHGEFGWPRMHRRLLACRLRVDKEQVRRLMQRQDIRAKGKPKFVVTTDSAHRLPVAPDWCSAASHRLSPTRCGAETSRTLPPKKAGCT